MTKQKRDLAILLLFDEENKVLLQHRDDSAAHLPGIWAFFGGGIEEGETVEQALKREMLEELSYRTKDAEKVMIQEYETSSRYGLKNVFIERYDSKQNLILGEGQGMGWYRYDQIKSLKMRADDLEILDFIKNKYNEYFN